ncbi:MAG: hypothetical protein K6F81_02110 [Acholeplasmatales bacterium]|nr:hypothetical protein [Acholeplasmatales bacterium]
MKEASKIMYTIGKVFNIIGLFLYGFLIAFGIIARQFANEIYERRTPGATYTEADVRIVGTTLMVIGIVAIIITLIIFILATVAKKKLNNNTKDIAPHVIMIIIGVFGDIFYLLGGIFGVVAETTENQ